MAEVIPLIVSAVAGTVTNKVINRKASPTSDQGVSSAPPVPPPSAADALKTAVPAAAAAAVRQKKAALGAGGRQSTILTGPSGLGDLGPSGTERKTILGY